MGGEVDEHKLVEPFKREAITQLCLDKLIS